MNPVRGVLSKVDKPACQEDLSVQGFRDKPACPLTRGHRRRDSPLVRCDQKCLGGTDLNQHAAADRHPFKSKGNRNTNRGEPTRAGQNGRQSSAGRGYVPVISAGETPPPPSQRSNSSTRLSS